MSRVCFSFRTGLQSRWNAYKLETQLVPVCIATAHGGFARGRVYHLAIMCDSKRGALFKKISIKSTAWWRRVYCGLWHDHKGEMGGVLESKKFQRVCQITHLERIVREACLRLRQSPFVLALICLFQITLAERTNVTVWS